MFVQRCAVCGRYGASRPTCFMYTDLPDAFGPAMSRMRGLLLPSLVVPAAAGCCAPVCLLAVITAPRVVSLSMNWPGASSAHRGWWPAEHGSIQTCSHGACMSLLCVLTPTSNQSCPRKTFQRPLHAAHGASVPGNCCSYLILPTRTSPQGRVRRRMSLLKLSPAGLANYLSTVQRTLMRVAVLLP